MLDIPIWRFYNKNVVITTESVDNMDILQSPFFKNISAEELDEMRRCRFVKERKYKKNSVIFSTGNVVREIGTVLSGSVNIENTDPWGNKTILSNISAGGIFAESYAFCGEPLMVDAVAAEDTRVLFLNTSALTDVEDTQNNWRSKMLVNLLENSVRKNIALSERIFCTAPKTIRGRLLLFLSSCSKKAKSSTFQIPFDRQQLADHLNLDRSALSKELGKMKRDGLIDFYKNTFKLKNTDMIE